jgi:Arc/MetJ-type ribon-helix-helix transcriptional regulator
MVIELTPEHQRIIERVIHMGVYRDAQDVINAALEALAEDVEDVAVTMARENEPRFTLDEVEAELRALGKLK